MTSRNGIGGDAQAGEGSLEARERVFIIVSDHLDAVAVLVEGADGILEHSEKWALGLRWRWDADYDARVLTYEHGNHLIATEASTSKNEEVHVEVLSHASGWRGA
jgi:hypothetical protein